MGKRSKRSTRQPSPTRDAAWATGADSRVAEDDRALFKATVERGAAARARVETRAREQKRDPSKATLVSRPFGALGALKKQLVEQEAARAAAPEAARAQPTRERPSSSARPDDPADDERAFARAMAGVATLPEDDSRPRSKTPKRGPLRLEDDEAEVMAELADLVAGIGDFDASFTTEHIEGVADGLDKRLLRKLKRGAFSYRSHLDLHGLTRAEARPRVEGFLANARKRGERCVLIVHGRGLHSKEGIPVLKEAVNSWLLRGRISRAVLAFCSARSIDGGLGAIYVLLRK